MIERLGLGDAPGRPADDDGELRLVVDLCRQRRIPADLGAGADDRARPLAEDERRRGGVGALLVDVVAVVAADGHDLAGPGDRCQELDVVERSAFVGDPSDAVATDRSASSARVAAGEQLGHRRWSGGQERPRRGPAVAGHDAEGLAARRRETRSGASGQTPGTRWTMSPDRLDGHPLPHRSVY